MNRNSAWLRPHGRPWQRGPARPVYENPWMALTAYDAIAPTGVPADYTVVHFKNLAIAILPLHADGTVTLVGQNRFPHGDYVWEIPEGGGALNANPLDSAKRELREETGLQAGGWMEILRLQMSNSITDERAVGFLATDLTDGDIDPDPTEDIVRVRIPFPDALEAVASGDIVDALTVAMLLRCHHMAVRGKLPEQLAKYVLA